MTEIMVKTTHKIMKPAMKLVIITGLSGSGKSIALNTLEDLDYYCIDNLPLGMLQSFTQQVTGSWGEEHYLCAIGVDARSSKKTLQTLPKLLTEFRTHVDTHIIFLYSDEQTLLTRFNETRRKHPLSNEKRPLLEALRIEKNLLEPIAQQADFRIDTSRTNLYQLRDIIRDCVDSDKHDEMSIQFQSFGFKYGTPIDVDMVFDARCLPNPHWESGLKQLTGQETKVIQFLEQHDEVHKMKSDIQNFLFQWIPYYEKTSRNYLTIAIGCTGGQHRSVYLATSLASYFANTRSNIIVRHRELS
ncbi:RNase adapter protein RapZ [hydrothermal vent metagenome]|uniref:RNase adapter protein RapZ n=1 Tax=hydrothermal vent metagenome TaxID=652676 RepID=A0A3B0Y5L6_9ZZZZ